MIINGLGSKERLINSILKNYYLSLTDTSSYRFTAIMSTTSKAFKIFICIKI